MLIGCFIGECVRLLVYVEEHLLMNRNAQTSKEPLESQAQGTSLFTALNTCICMPVMHLDIHVAPLQICFLLH